MWLELHDSDGKSMFVNLANATDFRRYNETDIFTQIAIGPAGEKVRVLYVVEEPRTIMTMIADEERRLASLAKTAQPAR